MTLTLPRILRNPSTKVKKKAELPEPLSDSLALRTDIRIAQEFHILKTLHQGSFSKVLLASRHSPNPTPSKEKERLVLKIIPESLPEDFYRELNYNYFLSPHPNVVKCYNVSILWDSSFVFPMEYAPFGSLSRFISPDSHLLGVTEAGVKLVAKQLSSALQFIHSLKLVHRDISPENVLVFKQDLSQIKLSDFGSTRPDKSLVLCLNLKDERDVYNHKHNYKLPPEICRLVKGECYYVHPSSDVWQLGILVYLLLTGGSEPWQMADELVDPLFSEFVDWLRRKNLRTPESFQMFTPRLLRLFKRIFEPKPKKRCEAREVLKYLEDEWISKLYRGGSFRLRKGVLERKASSSTNRSRSTGRNNSTRRKSSRSLNAHANTGCGVGVGVEAGAGGNGNNSQRVQKESSTGPADSARSGTSRDKLSDVDRDFVKERVGQWILQAATPTNPTPTTLTVPSLQSPH